jgi:hypothetical protein
MAEQNANTGGKQIAADRKERLAAQLRVNLRRRKIQSRAIDGNALNPDVQDRSD